MSKESPCGHGYVTCVSIYCGPDVHFGRAKPRDSVLQSQLWVDTLLEGGPGDEARPKPWLCAVGQHDPRCSTFNMSGGGLRSRDAVLPTDCNADCEAYTLTCVLPCGRIT